MASQVPQFIAQQFSVGSALQNILFYGMLAFLVCLIVAQLQTKHLPIRQRAISK
jgi:predicted cobalt transporter CbtA